MKRLNFMFLVFVCLLMLIGCSKPGDETETRRNWQPEYDYVTNCDIFHDDNQTEPPPYTNFDFGYAVDKLKKAKTDFAPNPDIGATNYISTGGNFTTYEDFSTFINANAWVDRYGTLVLGSYIAGVNSYHESGVLGVALHGGEYGKAAAFSFMRNIVNDPSLSGYDSTTRVHGNVMHELGHARAKLPHLCNGKKVNPPHNNPHRSHTCIMANFPLDSCMDYGGVTDPDMPPLDWIDYCSGCQDSLAKVGW